MKSNKKTKSAMQDKNSNDVLQDIKTQDKSPEALGLLKILAMSDKNIGKSNAKGITETFSDIRKELGIAK